MNSHNEFLAPLTRLIFQPELKIHQILTHMYHIGTDSTSFEDYAVVTLVDAMSRLIKFPSENAM